MTIGKIQKAERKTTERARISLPVGSVDGLRREAERENRPLANFLYQCLTESPTFRGAMKRAGHPIEAAR